MTTVGLRKFRYNLKAYLSRTRLGEKIFVMNHSKVAFIMTPPAQDDNWQRITQSSANYNLFAKSIFSRVEHNNLLGLVVDKLKDQNIFRIRRGSQRLTIAVLDVEENV